MAAGSASDGAAIEAKLADWNDADVPGAAVALSPPQPARSVETENAPTGSMGAPTSSLRALRRDTLGCSCMSSGPISVGWGPAHPVTQTPERVNLGYAVQAKCKFH